MDKLFLICTITLLHYTLHCITPKAAVRQNNFTCFVNGKIFTPSGPLLGEPSLSCTYRKKNGYDFLYLKGQRTYNGKIEAIWLKAIKVKLKENAIYKLADEDQGTYASWYDDDANYSFINTSEQYNGELVITKLDEETQTVTGNFWFNVLLPDGKIIHVTDGYFDLIYN